MHNPFAEVVDESTDADLIEQAKHGSRDALEKLVLRHQSWIYNIAVRMGPSEQPRTLVSSLSHGVFWSLRE
jgi:hypothetical protein